MDPCGLSIGISILACTIAKDLSDNDLTLLSAVLTQLGDSLATIAAQRGICQAENEAAAKARPGTEKEIKTPYAI